VSRLLRVAAILAATLTPSLFTVTAQESHIALTHVTVVDVTAGRTIPDQTVLIRGDRVAAVGSSTVQVPAGARQVDLTGKFIVPGFFDMHAHAALAATQTDQQSRRRMIEAELLRRVREGVLGIRDMGAPFEAIAELKREASADQPLRPRMAHGAAAHRTRWRPRVPVVRGNTRRGTSGRRAPRRR
jgi:imidazolonepropionase-like amidohydrolase